MRDRIVSVVLIILSVLICLESSHLKLGTYHNPGPGFLPFGVGMVLGFLSFILFFQSFKEKQEKENPLEEKRWKNIFLVLAFLFTYAFLIEKIGFVISTLLFVGAIMKIIEAKRWLVVIVVSVAASFGTYLIFEVWLQTQLPKGILW